MRRGDWRTGTMRVELISFWCVCLFVSRWSSSNQVVVSSSVSLNLPSLPNATTCEHRQMTRYLHTLSRTYPNYTRLHSIGRSVEGRELWVMILSDNPNFRPQLRPQVKFVGNISGFSGPACFVLLKLIKYLLETLSQEESETRRMLTMTEIHILPNLNPDGYARAIPGNCRGGGRRNANGINLNRNFPDIFEEEEKTLEPETLAVIRWVQENNFLLSVSLSSGAWVITYPFDSIPSDGLHYIQPHNEPHLTPDDDIFKHLAFTYVGTFENKPGDWHCPALGRTFTDGIINGAEWEPIRGTMLDFNYVNGGTFELMVAIACCYNENDSEVLENLWERNKHGLLQMIKETDTGVRGIVVDSTTQQPLEGVQLLRGSQNYLHDVDNSHVPFVTNKRGEFWRPLLPGKYILKLSFEDYQTKVVKFEVTVQGLTTLRINLYNLKRSTTTVTPSTRNSITSQSTQQMKTTVQSSLTTRATFTLADILATEKSIYKSSTNYVTTVLPKQTTKSFKFVQKGRKKSWDDELQRFLRLFSLNSTGNLLKPISKLTLVPLVATVCHHMLFFSLSSPL